MSPKARREYLQDMRARYARAAMRQKSQLLDEVVAMTGYHRKYAIAALHREPIPRLRRRSAATYGAEVQVALRAIWEAAGYPWSVRLRAAIPLWLPWLEQREPLPPSTRKALLRISARSIDRLLRSCRGELRRRNNSGTATGPWLKHQIPIRAERWDVTTPGWLEIDLVAHCGDCNGGEFINSLNSTDIASGWTETRAILGKGHAGVVAALDDIRQCLPFQLVGIDSDSGSEFINTHLFRWCERHKLKFTRSRPYKKNDNAHIEQKNWTHVRKIFGWLRFENPEILEEMNALYCNELRIWMNYFQPSVKLIRKERIGSRVRKHFDSPQTPLDRLIAVGTDFGFDAIGARAVINPFELTARISSAIAHVASLAADRLPTNTRVHGPSIQPLNRKNARLERAVRNAMALRGAHE